MAEWTPEMVYAATSIALIGLGLYALIVRRHMIRRLMAVNIMGTGIFVLFIAMASRARDGTDPLPQAMVLTGIVVAVSATALGLVLIQRIYAVTGSTRLAEDDVSETDEVDEEPS